MKAQLFDGTVLEFEDGTPQEVVMRVVKQQTEQRRVRERVGTERGRATLTDPLPVPEPRRPAPGTRAASPRPYVAGDERIVAPRPAEPDVPLLEQPDPALAARRSVVALNPPATPDEIAQAYRRRPLAEAREGVEPSATHRAFNATIQKPNDRSLGGLALESAGDAGRGLLMAAQSLGGATLSAVQAGAEAVGQGDSTVAKAAGMGGRLAREAEARTANPTDRDSLTQAVVQSFAQSFPMAIALGGAALPAIMATAAADDYGRSRDRGVGHSDAVQRAAFMGLAEGLGEKFSLPALQRLVAGAAGSMTSKEFGKAVAELLVREQVGEQATLAMQSAYEVGNVRGTKPNMTLEDYLTDMAETAKITLGQSLLSAGVAGGVNAAARRMPAATQVAGAINARAEQFAQFFAPPARGLPPTQARTQSLQRLDELAAAFGLTPKAVTAVRDAATSMPADDVPAFLARAIEGLDRRRMFFKPLDPQALSDLAQRLRPPEQVAAPEAPAAPAAAPAEAPAQPAAQAAPQAPSEPVTVAPADPAAEVPLPRLPTPTRSADAAMDTFERQRAADEQAARAAGRAEDASDFEPREASDILNPKGAPWASKGVATKRLKELGDGYRLARVNTGWVVKPVAGAPDADPAADLLNTPEPQTQEQTDVDFGNVDAATRVDSGAVDRRAPEPVGSSAAVGPLPDADAGVQEPATGAAPGRDDAVPAGTGAADADAALTADAAAPQQATEAPRGQEAAPEAGAGSAAPALRVSAARDVARVEADEVKPRKGVAYAVYQATERPGYESQEALSLDDADFEIEFLQTQQERGRLRPESIANSEFGKRLDTQAIQALNDDMRADPAGTLQALRDSIAAKRQKAAPATDPAPAPAAAPFNAAAPDATEAPPTGRVPEAAAPQPTVTEQLQRLKRRTAEKKAAEAAPASVEEPNLAAAKALMAEQKAATGNPKAEAEVRRKARELASKTPQSDEKTMLALDMIATRLGMGEGSKKGLEFADPPAPAAPAPSANTIFTEDAAARNGTLDPATVKVGDKLEMPDGTQQVVEDIGDKGEIFASEDGSGGRYIGKDMRGIKRLLNATHADPGQPAEPVTPAVVADAIKTAAKNEDRPRSEMKAEALRMIDEAIAKAPSIKDNPRAVHPDNLGENERAAQYRDIMKSGQAKTYADAHKVLMERYVASTPRIKIKVPGDGEFTVINTKEKLREFRKQIESSPGFRDKLPTFPIGKATTSANQGPDGLAREMLDDGEPVNALEILDAAGKPMMFGNGNDGTALPYTHSEAVEVGGFPAFVGRGWSDKKGGASGWTVINLKSGLRIGKGDTKADALANAKKTVEDPKNAERLARAVKEGKGADGQPFPTQEELRERFLAEGAAKQQATFDANDARIRAAQEYKKREAGRDAAYQAIMGEDAKRPMSPTGSSMWTSEQIKAFLDRAEKIGKVDDALALLDDLGLTDEESSTGRMTAVPIQNWRKSYEARKPAAKVKPAPSPSPAPAAQAAASASLPDLIAAYKTAKANERALADAKNVNLSELARAVDATSAARAPLVAKLAEQPALSAMNGNGLRRIVAGSAQKQGQWQLTRFDQNGEPWGDSQYTSQEAAIDDFLREVDIDTLEMGDAEPAAPAPSPAPAAQPVATFGTPVKRGMTVAQFDAWAKENATRQPEQFAKRTEGVGLFAVTGENKGFKQVAGVVGSRTVADDTRDMRVVYRLDDGRLVWWRQEDGNAYEVAANDPRLTITMEAPQAERQQTERTVLAGTDDEASVLFAAPIEQMSEAEFEDELRMAALTPKQEAAFRRLRKSAAQPVAEPPVSSREGQMRLANRGSRIAVLKLMNDRLRRIAPDEAWADSNIENAADLDALQDQISEALVKAERGPAAVNPLRAELDAMSGAELRAIMERMNLAGARMMQEERIAALLAEDPAEVRAAMAAEPPAQAQQSEPPVTLPPPVLAGSFSPMRGHVADGVRVLVSGDRILTVKSSMNGWELRDDAGTVVSGPHRSAQAVESAVVQLDAAAPSQAEPMAWHTPLPEQGEPATDKDRTYPSNPKSEIDARKIVGRLAREAMDAITRVQMTNITVSGMQLYPWVLPAQSNRYGVVRLLPEDQVPGGAWQRVGTEPIAVGGQRERAENQLIARLGSAPILATGKPAQAPAEAADSRPNIADIKRDATLDKEVSDNGERMTRRQWVERKVAEGLKPKVEQEDRIKPMSRMAYFRATNEEQRAHERKIKEAGKKDVYWIGDYEVTKTEHDYAVSLGAAEAAESAPEMTPAETARRNEFLDRQRAYWDGTAIPAIRDYLRAFDAFGVERMERNRIKPAGMSAREWLESFVSRQSTWDGDRKTGLTGIQALSGKDLWPTEDGSGERLRKAMLEAVKALKNAPSTNDDLMAEAFMEPKPAATRKAAESAAPAPAPSLRERAEGMKARAYPLAPPGSRYEETDKPITMMTPDAYLAAVRPLEIDEASRDNIDDLKQHILSGKTLDPLHIRANGKEDGRHRAVAAKELGIKQVPVVDERATGAAKAKAAPGVVENFGEALPPARLAMAAKLDESLSDDDIANRPLSEIWPLAENEAIEDTFAAAVAHAARAEVPAKPRVAYKLKQWVQKVKTVRELAGRIVSGRATKEQMAGIIVGPRATMPTLRDWWSKVTLLEQVPRDQWKRIGEVEERPDAAVFRDGKPVPRPMVRVRIDDKAHWIEGAGTVADALPKVRELLSGAAPEQRMEFAIYERRSSGTIFVTKKGDPEKRSLMEFATVEEARAAVNEYDGLAAAWEAVKARDNITERDLRSAENRPRTGKDHRGGKDVTVEQFQETFGFRGGEFGKWVQQGKGDKERQALLNQSYDALMDLADIIGVPPRAMSLNGTLGLALGSRGSGWASAHFEPSNLVINLTKTRGAGTLAHEWFHALDNYFSRMRRGGAEAPFTGNQNKYRDENYITHRPESLLVRKDRARGFAPLTQGQLEARRERLKAGTRTGWPPADSYDADKWERDPSTPEGVRPEVEQRFAALVQALKDSPMTKRAALLDKSGGYWTRTLELAARSFENYVIAKMHEQGYHNDFLVNVKKPDEVAKSDARYPYLLAGEVKPIADAFDALFSEVKTRDSGDGNVALFSRSTGESAATATDKPAIEAAVAATLASWANKPHVLVVANPQSPGVDEAIREADARQRAGGAAPASGVYFKNTVYLFTDGIANPQQALTTLYHEVLGHYGMRSVFGDALRPMLGQMAALNSERVKAKAVAYGIGRRTPQGFEYGSEVNGKWVADPSKRFEAAEEVLAELAQTRPDSTWVQRALAAIRTWLRDAGLLRFFTSDQAMSDAEMIRTFLAPARGFVERRAAAQQRSAAPAFSRPGVRANVNRMTQDQIEREIKELMPRVDRAYESGNAPLAERLDARLETLMDAMEANLLELQEDTLDKAYAGVNRKALEMQGEAGDAEADMVRDLAARWRQITRPGSMESREYATDAERAATLRDLLGDYAWKHGGLKDDLSDATIIEAAKDAAASVYGMREAQAARLKMQQVAGAPRFSRPDQTQTLEFKRWFGDWQALRAQTKLERMEPVQINVPAAWTDLEKAELRRQVAQQLDAAVKARATIQHPELGAIQIGNRGARKTISESPDPAKLLIAADLANVLPKAFVGASEPGDRQGVKQRDTLMARVRVGDTELVALFAVNLQDDGRWYYNTVVVQDAQKEVDPGAYAASGAVASPLEQPLLTGVDSFVRRPFQRVNPASVSKVVGADGKPLVVYHGTAGGDFVVFSPGREGNTVDSNYDLEGLGFFFTPSEQAADGYANNAAEQQDKNVDVFRRTMAVYARVRNPKMYDSVQDVLSAAGDAGGGAQLQRQLKAQGYDGLIYGEEVFWGPLDKPSLFGLPGDTDAGYHDVIVAFYPEQIKSAIGNSGQFDTENPDIRFSRPTPKAAESNAKTQAAFQASEVLASAIKDVGALSWWSKTVGTPYNLAQRYPLFNVAFRAMHRMAMDTTEFSLDAARLAPGILPQLDTLRDIVKGPLNAEDAAALQRPVFDGTLLWTRGANGKPVRVKQQEESAAAMSADDKAWQMMRDRKLDPRVMKMWQGQPQDWFESVVEKKYAAEYLRPGIVWTPQELKTIFKLNPRQIGLYQQTRKAIDASLDNLAVTSMVRLTQQPELRDQVLGLSPDEAAEVLRPIVEAQALQAALNRNMSPEKAEKAAEDAGNRVTELADRASQLKAEGYVPLMRFGDRFIKVIEDGEQVHFQLYEGNIERSADIPRLRKMFPGATLEHGTVPQEAYKLFEGVTPETLALFADVAGLTDDQEKSDLFQQYLQSAISNRSAMKRLIHRKGIAGFNEDVPRVLAAFITSNARASSQNLNVKPIQDAIQAINPPGERTGQGQLQDYAVKLREFMGNPSEQWQALRGLLFHWFLGGNLSSAAVNMAQPFQVTFPELAKTVGTARAAQLVTRAAATVAMKRTGLLGEALKRAEAEGLVTPQEYFHLVSMASGAGHLRTGATPLGKAAALANNSLTRLAFIWGRPFAWAEMFNRRVTFIAGYQAAAQSGKPDPYDFAAELINQTQFIYGMVNRPVIMRRGAGATLLTFQTYTISMLELAARNATSKTGRKALALMLLMLLLSAGLDGFPFMENVEDVIDAIAQRSLGLNWQTKVERNKKIAELLAYVFEDETAEAIAAFVAKGVSGLAGVPADVSGRFSMAKIIPGTGALTLKENKAYDLADILGPAGSLATQLAEAGAKAMGGDVGQGAKDALPLAGKNLVKGIEMATTGEYRDTRGRNVVEVDLVDAAFKAAGFQPSAVARPRSAERVQSRRVEISRIVEQQMVGDMAAAIRDGKQDEFREAVAKLKRWNERNPESPIVITPQQVRNRLQSMLSTSEQRLLKRTPREMRGSVAQELAQ